MAENSGTGRHPRFDDDLIGLDPDDPEAREFAAHLDRMQRCEPAFTIEASLRGVGEFADGSNRAGGLRWWVAVLIVLLIVAGVLVAAWDTLGNLLEWLAR
ncbi:hypothetical protein [Saccharomonospora saliphila]|uniref:hypothetical protein n=1 Tax=Saccharomonospora saliphila TaxID=369829 RepID=UPI000381471D|nr:hypothetical protein [Saccharomonospora saliphila]